MRRKLFPSAVLLAAISVCLARPVHAVCGSVRKARPARPKTEQAQASGAAAAAGVRAYIDPATGKLREPTAEEARALSRGAAARSVKDLEAVLHPNGMTSVDLKDAFLMDIVVRRNPDRSLSLECAPFPRKPPAPALEEK